jgi:hypothetical protein
VGEETREWGKLACRARTKRKKNRKIEMNKIEEKKVDRE